jgi:hypothetical protein
MIPVPNPIPEPIEFDVRCRQKGKRWIREKEGVAGRPPDYWSPFRFELAKGFSERCGYGAMWISSGTVDHHVSVHEDVSLAYEWDNYRYVEAWINSSKNRKEAAAVLDPFEVGEGWFRIELPSLQLTLTDRIPPEFQARAERTISSLPIQHDERILRTRRAWLEMYEQGAPLHLIQGKAPLIAEAIERENWEQRVG